jgi:hypothetical protein
MRVGLVTLVMKQTMNRGEVMQLQEIDTIQDLILWAKKNMPSALIVETEGEIIIQTGLESTMGGYLHEIEREEEE